MPALFEESEVEGFTIAINLNTGFCETPKAAESVWAIASNFIASFLKSVPRWMASRFSDLRLRYS